MGQAANKMSRDQYEKRVYQLRAEISHKRQELSAQLSELKRRHESALVKARKAAQLAGFAAVGIVVAGSLLNALRDLFRPDQAAGAERPENSQQAPSPLPSALMDIGMGALRFAAMQYVRGKMEELQARWQQQESSREHCVSTRF